MATINKDKFNKYKIYRSGFYTLDKAEIGAIQNSDNEFSELIGLGFEVVLSKYENSPLILDYYAICFLYNRKLIRKSRKNVLTNIFFIRYT